MSLEEGEKSLAKREKMLHECFSMSFSQEDVFVSSPLYKQIKEEMAEKGWKNKRSRIKTLGGLKCLAFEMWYGNSNT